MHRTILAALAVVLCFALQASAQTGPCPTGNAVSVIAVGNTIHACVVPSTDPALGHNATDPDTLLPVVARYDIVLLNDGDPITAPAQATIALPKTALNSDGVMWGVLPNASVPINRRFRAAAIAVGQPGSTPSGRSALSNPFVVKNPPNPAAPQRMAVP